MLYNLERNNRGRVHEFQHISGSLLMRCAGDRSRSDHWVDCSHWLWRIIKLPRSCGEWHWPRPRRRAHRSASRLCSLASDQCRTADESKSCRTCTHTGAQRCCIVARHDGAATFHRRSGPLAGYSEKVRRQKAENKRARLLIKHNLSQHEQGYAFKPILVLPLTHIEKGFSS